jgi:hypothetical protein
MFTSQGGSQMTFKYISEDAFDRATELWQQIEQLVEQARGQLSLQDKLILITQARELKVQRMRLLQLSFRDETKGESNNDL